MKIQKFSRAARAEMLAQRVTGDTLNAIQNTVTGWYWVCNFGGPRQCDTKSDMLGRFVMLAHEKTSRGGDALVKEIHWLQVAWPIRVALCRSVCAGITYWVGYFGQPAVRPLVKVAGAGDSSCRRVWPVWVTSLRRFCMQIPSFENPFGVASNVEIN